MLPVLTRKSRLEFHAPARMGVLPASSRNGGGRRAANGVEPKVIKILEQALNEARRGEIIAAAIVFLCSTPSAHITGSTIHVNGGTFMP